MTGSSSTDGADSRAPENPGSDRSDSYRTGAGDAASFYSRWARLYDVVARRTPGIGRLRRRALDGLDLDRGDTVLEVGCGTGANLPLLAREVGPTGRVLGVDLSPGALRRAGRYCRGYPQIEVFRADATRPPVADDDEVDAVLATFVVGMLDDPAAAVDGWCDLVGPGGRVSLLHLRRSEHTLAPVLNAGLGVATVLSTPPTTRVRYEEDLTRVLDERVRAAGRALRERSTPTASESHLLDLVQLTAGRVEES